LPISLTIEAETMTNVNVSAYNVSGGITWLNSNGRIETPVRITTAGNYAFEVFAGGTTAQGVYPQVAITVNGVNRANWFLTSTNLAGGPWQAATNFTVSGNIESWTDTGFAGAPPLSPAAPQRFYRVRQSGP